MTKSLYGFDVAGNVTSRTVGGVSEFWVWDSSGRLGSLTRGSQVTGYVYSADGSQLVRRDPDGSRTLFLADGSQLRVDGGVSSGLRFLSFAGRSLLQQDSGGRWILYQDQTGSSMVLHNAVSIQVFVRRTLDPFGNQLGGLLGAASWPNRNGFLDKPHSSLTGITDIGARKYDPGIGRFMSVDPILDVAQPGTLNGYSYTSGDPINYSDPTGLAMMADRADDGGGPRLPSPRVHPSQLDDMYWPGQWSAEMNKNAAKTLAFTSAVLAGAAISVVTLNPVAVGAGSGAVASMVEYASYQSLQGEDIDINELLDRSSGGAVWGGITGVALYGASKAISLIRGSINKHIKPPVVSDAAQSAANAGVKTPEFLLVGDVQLPAVPKGAIGTPVKKGEGLIYQIPRGIPGLSDKVTSIRIMAPRTGGRYPYPNGYAVYMNEMEQTINPFTG